MIVALLVCDKHLHKTASQIAKDKERNTMLDNQFQFAILATEDRIRAIRSRPSSRESAVRCSVGFPAPW